MKNAVSISVKSRVFLNQCHCGTPYTLQEENPETLYLATSIKDCHGCLGVECLDTHIRIHWVLFVTWVHWLYIVNCVYLFFYKMGFVYLIKSS